MKRGIVALAAVTLTLIGSCGSTTGQQPGTGSPMPTVTPTTPPLGTLIAVVEGSGGFDMKVRFVSLDGTQVLSVAPTTPKGEVTFVRFAGSRALFVERVVHSDAGGKTTSYEYVLKALHRDGSIESLQALGVETSVTPSIGEWVFSPDGSHWLWTETSYRDANTLHSVLHLGSLGGSDRIIETMDSQTSRASVGYSWNEGGPLVVHTLWGIGSSFPLGFGAMGDVYLLDTTSWKLTLLWPESPCQLHARASDGTIACLEGKYTLKIGHPPSLAISISLDTTRFAGAGAVSFKPGPAATLLAIGGCSIAGGWYNCSTDLVDVKTGDIWRFGPDGLTASGWLDDGSIVAEKIPDMDSPDQAKFTYIVSPAGQARQLASGYPAGIWPG